MFAKDGYPFIIAAIVAALLFTIVPKFIWITLSVLALLLFLWFFRDPERIAPDEENIAVSAADGKVVEIEENVEFNGEKYKKIGVFMNVFSVHVNRTPVTGVVESIEHIPGKFVNASRPDAAILNERNIITFNTEYGKVITVQVAGLVARRTVSYVEPGNTLSIGDRFGMIKFSSRIDHYFPMNAEIQVSVDDNVKAGESILARFNKA